MHVPIITFSTSMVSFHTLSFSLAVLAPFSAEIRILNGFFFASGSRYVSWLPNFSVEVTHINNVLRTSPIVQTNATAAHTSQLRNMARQVQQMFPRYPLSTIIADLQQSRSMEITIDNILEDRLIPPGGRFDFDDDDSFGDSTPSSNEPHTGEISRRSSDAGADYSTSSSSSGGMSATSNATNQTESGYEIERSTNIFGNRNDLLQDER